MKIIKNGMCGTVESSDILVTIEPNADKGIEIQLKSSVEMQFGMHIKRIITDTLLELHIVDALVIANDKGALDCVIKSRVQTAVYRAANSADYKW